MTRTLLFAFALGCCSGAWAQVYARRADAHSGIVLSNFKSEDTPELLIRACLPQLGRDITGKSGR